MNDTNLSYYGRLWPFWGRLISVVLTRVLVVFRVVIMLGSVFDSLREHCIKIPGDLRQQHIRKRIAAEGHI